MQKAKKTIKDTKTSNRTFVSFVLDETGSMSSFKNTTIDGFNGYVKGLRDGGNEMYFTFTKFNSAKVEIVHDAIAIKDVKELNQETYLPSNYTPLYDAVGRTIRSVESKCGNDKVIIAIMTDGEENASREYNQDTISRLIDEKKKAGWVFVFLGANQEAYLAGGEALGINRKNSVIYNSENTVGVCCDLSIKTCHYAQGSFSNADSDFYSEANLMKNPELFSRPKQPKNKKN